MNSSLGQQLELLKQKKVIMVILIFFFVAVFTWTSVSLFTSQKKISISSELRTLSKPLTPVIDQEIFSILEQKRFFDDSELMEFPIYKILTTLDGSESKLVNISVDKDVLVLPTPTPVPTLAPVVEELPLNSASESGDLLFNPSSEQTNPQEEPLLVDEPVEIPLGSDSI